MNPRLTKSSFRFIYGALLGLYLVIGGALHFVLVGVIGPNMIESRIENVRALIDSHEASIRLHNIRALRDELTAENVIRHDLDFDHIIPASPSTLAELKHTRNVGVSAG